MKMFFLILMHSKIKFIFYAFDTMQILILIFILFELREPIKIFFMTHMMHRINGFMKTRGGGDIRKKD